MYLSNIKNVARSLLLIIFVILLMLTLVGFRDLTSEIAKEGVKYSFKARIMEKVASKEGKGLVVEKMQSVERTKGTIYVVVTGETKIGYTVERYRKKYIKFDDLEIGWNVMIEGLKSVQTVDGQEVIVVLARDIEPVE